MGVATIVCHLGLLFQVDLRSEIFSGLLPPDVFFIWREISWRSVICGELVEQLIVNLTRFSYSHAPETTAHPIEIIAAFNLYNSLSKRFILSTPCQI